MGLGASATIGAKIVQKRAETLHVPNTRPINRFGKYCNVLMYRVAKAIPVPNLAARTDAGTILVISADVLNHNVIPAIDAIILAIVRVLTVPILITT